MKTTAEATRDVIVRTLDFDAARRFYTAALGLAAFHDEADLMGFEAGGFRLYVERGAAHGSVFEMLVTDPAASRMTLLAAGCTVVEEDPAVPRCYLRDPFGLVFNLAARRDAAT